MHFLILLGLVSFELVSFSAKAQTPSIIFSADNIKACQGTGTSLIPYTTENNPSQYTIVYQDGSFIDIPQWTSLPPSPLAITIPAGISPKSYFGTIMVRNDSTGLVSKEKVFSVTIELGVLPAFDPIDPFPSNSPTQMLPSYSQNGIFGTWSLIRKNMQIDGTANCTYAFTPATGQCAQKTKVIVEILPPLSITKQFTKPPRTKTNKLVGSPPVTTIEYAGSPFCNMSDPVQVVINGQSGGKFSAKRGLSLNSRTGAINPATSKSGLHKITYRVKSGRVMNGFSTSTSVVIFSPPKQPHILFKDSVLISSSTVGNQWYNSMGPIEGDTSQNHRIDYDDEYYVIVKMDDCMSKPSATVSYIADRDGDQRNRFKFGFSIGANTMGFFIKHVDSLQVTQIPNPGVNLNVIGDYRLGKKTNIRIMPGIVFNRQELNIKELPSQKNDKLSMMSFFFESPIALNYHLPRVNNQRPYLTAGISPRFEFMEIVDSDQHLRTLNNFNVYFDFGLGIDSYLNQSGITTELKVSFGMSNSVNWPMKPDDRTFFSFGINKLFSNMIILSFQF